MTIVKVSGRRARRKAVLSAYNTLALSLGAYFQQARMQRNLDQTDVAKMTGMSQSQVSYIETAEWQHADNESLRQYIRAIQLPNETLLIETIEALDAICERLPEALA